jgi:hypothetical protein
MNDSLKRLGVDLLLSNHFIELQALEELRQLMKLRQTNEELLEYFASSLWWLIHYSEKHDIPLPEREKIIQAVERVMNIAKSMPTDQLNFNNGSQQRKIQHYHYLVLNTNTR